MDIVHPPPFPLALLAMFASFMSIKHGTILIYYHHSIVLKNKKIIKSVRRIRKGESNENQENGWYYC